MDPWQPVGMFVEPELSRRGQLENVATILLANRECPFRCVMCDLWRHTLTEPTPNGAIPVQVERALERLEPARHVKLYNSGNFFDTAAVPRADHEAIAARVAAFETVIVENHPKLCGSHCREFRDRLQRLGAAELELALGLETAHEPTLQRLNKEMTRDDYRRAAAGLREDGIFVRTFVLLRPPGMAEQEGIEWALRSLEFAFAAGSDVCSVIATRGGNGIMEDLAAQGLFAPPRLASLEAVLETALTWRRGRVFADLWQIEQLPACERCRLWRVERLRVMNHTQQIPPRVSCDCS